MRYEEDGPGTDVHPARRRRRRNTVIGGIAILFGLFISLLVVWRDQLDVLSFALVVSILLFGAYLWDSKEGGALIRDILASAPWRKHP